MQTNISSINPIYIFVSYLSNIHTHILTWFIDNLDINIWQLVQLVIIPQRNESKFNYFVRAINKIINIQFINLNKTQKPRFPYPQFPPNSFEEPSNLTLTFARMYINRINRGIRPYALTTNKVVVVHVMLQLLHNRTW